MPPGTGGITRGWIALILGVLQIIAAIAILAGSQAARWFAVVVIGLNAIGQMFFIPAYPFWSWRRQRSRRRTVTLSRVKCQSYRFATMSIWTSR
jgi:hypothetical protein